jgi:tRNA A37 methylthiotransferase MiaB
VAEIAVKLLREGRKTDAVSDLLDVEEAPLETMNIFHAYRDRSYIKIEDGCDNHCT